MLDFSRVIACRVHERAAAQWWTGRLLAAAACQANVDAQLFRSVAGNLPTAHVRSVPPPTRGVNPLQCAPRSGASGASPGRRQGRASPRQRTSTHHAKDKWLLTQS